MKFFPLLLLAAVSTATFDRSVKVPAADIRGLELTIKNRPGTVELRYRVVQGEQRVRAVVLSKADQPLFRAGHTVAELASTPYAGSGSLKVHLVTPGDYVIILDNRPEPKLAARVDVRGQINYDREPVNAWELPPHRKAAVITASLAVFFGLLLWPGRKLVAAVNARERRGLPLP